MRPPSLTAELQNKSGVIAFFGRLTAEAAQVLGMVLLLLLLSLSLSLFMGQGEEISIFILHLILRGCWKDVLCWDADIVFSEISIAASPIVLVLHGYFFEGVSKYLSSSCISQMRSAYCIMLTLKGFVISL